MKKKGQIGMREAMLTLVIAGILAIIGLMIFANVSNSVETVFDRDTVTVRGETVAIASGAGQLAHGALDTEDFNTLIAFGNDTIGFTSLSVVNLNISVGGVVAVNVSDGNYEANYTYLADTNSIITKTNLDTTILDSFELGIIALIVLAAVLIIGTLFMLGK